MVTTKLGAPSYDLGYEFDAPQSAERPVYHRLTVWLRPAPTEHHFDPESVACPIASAQLGRDCLSLRHPWTEGSQYRTSIGMIELRDRRGKMVQAFTFGGDLRLEAGAAVTVAIFTSPAPLLPVLEPESLPASVAVEVEALMGQCRAQWSGGHPDDDFDQALSRLDTLQLYTACLVSVEARLRAVHAGDAPLHAVQHFIERERAALRTAGRWSLAERTLLQLLEGEQGH